jgi:branched-chain amino acid transport system permease protein
MTPLVFAHHAISPAERFKDALAVALIALLLGIPMIGLTTVDQGGALRIASPLADAVRLRRRLLRGRLLLRYASTTGGARRLAREQAAAPVAGAAWRRPLLTWVGWGALGVSLVLPIVFSDNRYVVDTATTVLIYVMLGWGLNVVVGLAGLLDLGYVAFYAVGAYTYAVLATSSAGVSGRRCRSPAPWRRLSGSCSAGRRCACAATTWRS